MQATNDYLALIGRVLLSLIYVWSGYGALTGIEGATKYIAAQGLPILPPTVQLVLVIIMEFGGGLLILLGLWHRLGVILLIIHTLLTAVVAHHFWTMAGGARVGNAINFYKNLSLVGGLLFLYLQGPGRYSLDRWMAKGSAS